MHDLIPCDLCHRTILKGERIETFVGAGERQQVCELCSPRALGSGWLRESELERQAPERARERGPRRSLWSRAVTWAEDQGLWGAPPSEGERGVERPDEPFAAPVTREGAEQVPERAPAGRGSSSGEQEGTERTPARLSEPAPTSGDRPPERLRARRFDEERDDAAPDPEIDGAVALVRRPGRAPSTAGLRELISGRRREPRDVSAVPTSRWGKIERALELFNASEHRRTIAGVGRSLGEPWVSALPLDDGPAAREVGIVVAWELSWYRYRIDLDDADQAVLLLDRGNELEDLDEELRHWNVGADAEGRLTLAVEAVS